MLQGIVIGHATSTIKHSSLKGWRLLIIQPIGPTGLPDGDPNVAIDSLGASPGQRVVLNSDGKASRALVGDDKTPARYFVAALVDE
jgi:ethanolamine utilization protein EutN